MFVVSSAFTMHIGAQSKGGGGGGGMGVVGTSGSLL